MSTRLAISLGQYSSPGRKDENQDFHGALIPEDAMLTTKGIAVALADGISTSKLGATAAETAVKSFLTDYFATSEAWSVQTSAQRVVSATNSWMHAQNMAGRRSLSDEERERGLICTFSALVLKSRTAHLFHVGDSRIARLSGHNGKIGRIETLTEAHRVELGGGESYLGRAMGLNRHVEIDYRRFGLQPGDIFILTTDGVHEHLNDAAIVAALAANDNLDDAARAIAQAALDAGSTDNLTVQLVRVDALPDGAITDLLANDAGLPPAPMLEPGMIFEGHAVLRVLHSGSRSHVYLARDLADGEMVAIKVPATDHAGDDAQMQALMLEEWIARRVDNPHVLKAPPLRAPRGHAYCVTHYVEGTPLDQWRRDHGRLDPAQMRDMVRQIASGLQALHRREILHRDLRPANIIVDAFGIARIIDFGSAQVAGLDEVRPTLLDAAYAGTVQYSAPELYLGHSATRRSDIYSLGVIAYQLMTGALPYGPRVAAAATPAAQKKLRYTPAGELNPDVPDWLDAAIARAVSIDPAQRYVELSEFVFDIEHPNAELIAPDPRPLLQRQPERLWQAVSAGLLLVILYLLWRGAHAAPSF
jgi:serine/threonine protein phosphatase PrpC